MAKGRRLTKLKSMLKKSFSKLVRSNSSIAAASISSDEDPSFDKTSGRDMFPVYVGKSRRRYLITSEVVDHPLFKELSGRSCDENNENEIIVSCEVVLFEHLLWMLENADPQPECLDELVGFYAC